MHLILWRIESSLLAESGTPAHTEGRGASFLLGAHYEHFCTKTIKSLERAGRAAAPFPPREGIPGLSPPFYFLFLI